MRYICHYKVADAVPDNGVIAYQDLAKACGLDSSQLKLNLRFAMTNRVFCEPRPGFVAHTIASLELKQDNPMLAFVQWLTGDCAPIVTHQIDAYEKWGHGSQEPNETAVNFAYNRDGGFFDFIQSDPVRETRFGVTIRQVSKQPAASPKHIANGFNWELLGNGTVVDVGGHIGYCAVTIAEAAPKLKVIVQDRPQVVAMATDPKTSAVPKELQDRISFEVHDYYQPQKTPADAYFYRKCLLNLSDKYAVKLIEALSPALKRGNRLLIMDFIQTDGPIPDSTFERYYRAVDLQMMSYYNCRYRTLDEWKELVSAGDARLVFESSCTSPGSAMPILSFIVQ
jgi:predicted O-methyltransferase YrrM